MTTEKLKQASEAQAKIAETENLIATCEQFVKQRFQGALPAEVSQFINADSSLCLEVVQLIKCKAEERLIKLKQDFSEI